MTAGNDMKSMLMPYKVQDTGPPEPFEPSHMHQQILKAKLESRVVPITRPAKLPDLPVPEDAEGDELPSVEDGKSVKVLIVFALFT